jgi:formate-dependent nitrite reductase cytochrome c552 subunit
MSPQLASEILSEVKLIQQFTDTYRRKFSSVIASLNGDLHRAPDAQAVRLCVEAVDMMLMSQRQLARAISRIGEAEPRRPRIAA